MHISTVRIRSVETASGFIVINEADFCLLYTSDAADE